MSPACTRYLIRFGIGLALYVLAIVVAGQLARGGWGPSPWMVLMTLPGIATMVWALVSYHREADELERAKLGEGVLIGFGIGVPAVLAVGLLESYGGPHLSWMWAFMILMAAWLVGAVVVAIRYR